MAERLVTDRLVLREWTVDDAAAALSSYGEAEVARWLAPVMDRVGDEAAMRVVLQQWMAEDERMLVPAGRWAIELRQDGTVIGGATLLPLPPDDEYEIRLASCGEGRPGARAMPPKPAEPWRAGRLNRAWSKSLLLCGQPTAAPLRRCAGSAWSGSARRRNTTTCGCRCTASVRQILPNLRAEEQPARRQRASP